MYDNEKKIEETNQLINHKKYVDHIMFTKQKINKMNDNEKLKIMEIRRSMFDKFNKFITLSLKQILIESIVKNTIDFW